MGLLRRDKSLLAMTFFLIAKRQTMIQLEALEERISLLGNHCQKYIFTIQRIIEPLIHDLERSGKMMKVHLWQPAVSHMEEMKVISSLHDDEKTRVEYISCYYALQFLYMNTYSLDVLQLNISSGRPLYDVYYNYMMNIGVDFRRLTTAGP